MNQKMLRTTRLRRNTKLTALVVIVLVWVLAYTQAARNTRLADQMVRGEASAMAYAFGRIVEANAERVDTIARAVRMSLPLDSDSFRARAAQLVAAHGSYHLDVEAYDARGVLVNATYPFTRGVHSIAESSRWQRLRRSGADQSVLSRAYRDPTNGRWRMALMRPVFTPAGTFGGAVAVLLDLRSVSDALSEERVGSNDVIAVLRASSREVLLRSRDFDRFVGAIIPAGREQPVDGIPNAAVFEGPSYLDRVTRYYGIYHAPRYDFTVVFGKVPERVLSHVRGENSLAYIAAGVMTALTVLLTIIFLRALMVREMSEAALHFERTRLAALLNARDEERRDLDPGRSD